MLPVDLQNYLTKDNLFILFDYTGQQNIIYWEFPVILQLVLISYVCWFKTCQQSSGLAPILIFYIIIKPLQTRIPSLLLLPSPLSCQSNFLILNISAKSIWIFTKFLGKLSVGVPRWLKQKNKQIYKHTNKQKK